MHAKSLILLSAHLCLVLSCGPRVDRSRGGAHLVLPQSDDCVAASDPTSRTYQFQLVMCGAIRTAGSAWVTASPDDDLDDPTLAAVVVERPDPVDAALAIVLCVRSGRCEPEGAGVRSGDHSFSYGLAATLAGAARAVTPAMVREAMTTVEVSRNLATTFVERYAACRTMLLAGLEALGPRFGQVYLTAIEEARRRWAADAASTQHAERFQATQAEVARALLAHQVTPALRDQVALLRHDVVTACQARGRPLDQCLGMPIARPLSLDLVRIHLGLGDGLAATAEARVASSVVDRSQLAYELHLAVEVAMAKERAQRDAWDDAVARHTPPEVLAESFGPHPPLDLGERQNSVGIKPPDAEGFERELRALPEPVRVMTDEVESVRRAGGMAVVRWKGVSSRYQRTTGCRETSKVDYITNDGHIVYRQHCTGPVVTRVDVKRSPDTHLPLDEARLLLAGDIVEAALRPRDGAGRIIAVRRGDARSVPVQRGGFAARR